MRARTCLLLALLWTPVRSAPAHAESNGAITVRANRGDTLELIAAEYYGDRKHKIYIMIENGLDHPRPLKNGERLRVPVSVDVTAEVGDTLSSLAEQYLGDSRRARYLAEFNGLAEGASIAAGQSVTIPLRVQYQAKRKESLRDIAAALFADPSKSALLKQYNFLTKDEINRGDSITVPIYMRVQAAKRPPPDAESEARIAKRGEMQERALRSLPIARAAWESGDFSAVKRDLTKLDIDYLDTEIAVQVAVLLGSAYIAFDDNDSAIAVFAKALERKPNHQLKRYDHSPKVRAVWQRAERENGNPTAADDKPAE